MTTDDEAPGDGRGDTFDPLAVAGLPRVREWTHRWDPLGVLDYLALECGAAGAMAAAHLLWPPVAETLGCVVLADRAAPDHVREWLDRVDGDRAAAERAINHVHLWDVFSAEDDDGVDEARLAALAAICGHTWRARLAAAWRQRSFEVAVTGDEDEEYGPTVTFWSVRR